MLLLLFVGLQMTLRAQNSCASPVLISDGSCITFNIAVAGGAILTGCNGGMNPRAYIRFTAPANGECVQFDFSGFTSGGTYQLATYTLGCASYVTNSGMCVSNVVVGQQFSYAGKSALGANLYLPGISYILCVQSDNTTPITVCMSTPDQYAPSDQCAGAIPVGLSPTTLYNGGDCLYSGSLDNPMSNDPIANELCAGSVENSQWTSFIAAAESIQITGSEISCTGGGCGFQFGIFKGACGSLTNIGCYGQKVCTGGQNTAGPTNPLGQVSWTGTSASAFTVNINGLVPGETVYLVMDGNADADCKYTLTGVNVLALPVELVSFDAYVDGKDVRLRWSTVSEHANAYFSLERFDDSNRFIEIARVAGSFYSDEIMNYEYLDEDLHDGPFYYRLKQIDFNGEYSYSKTIVALVDSDQKLLVKRLNMMGQPMNESLGCDGFVIEVYDDGTVRKVFRNR
jgi:hypothetical protein